MKILLAWVRLRRELTGRNQPSDNLTAEELTRLARWANAYRAEAIYGADNGKRWEFARYLVETGRLSEELVRDAAASAHDDVELRSWRRIFTKQRVGLDSDEDLVRPALRQL
jgi:hypothetical protein